MIRVPQRTRNVIQAVVLLLCLTPVMRLTHLDMPNASLVVLGVGFAKGATFIPVVIGLALFALVFFLSSRYGRIFCAFACPVHTFLEFVLKRSGLGRTASIVLPLALAQSAIAFVIPYDQQSILFQKQDFPQPILFAHLIATGVFVTVFTVYRERFCRSACPYSILQNLTQTDTTAVVVYKEGECINCSACDRVCPMRLDVRKESDDLLCTNCGLCIKACDKVLNGKAVLELSRPEPSEKGQADDGYGGY